MGTIPVFLSFFGDPIMKHLLSAGFVVCETLSQVSNEAKAMKSALSRSGSLDCWRGMVMASVFRQPSTRTRFGFESAMIKLGGHVISSPNAGTELSFAKGESLPHFMKTMNSLPIDVLLLRHDDALSFEIFDGKAPRFSLINAGDRNPGEHPSQAIADVITMDQQLSGGLTGKHVCLAGDLKRSRVIRSLCQLLPLFKDVRVTLVPAPGLDMDGKMEESLKQWCLVDKTERLVDVTPRTDVIYINRVQ